MSKKKGNKKRHSAESGEASVPAESRAAEAVTVAWMMAALASFVGGVVAAVSYAALFFTAPDRRITTPMVTIPFLLFFIASITGAICLVLTPLALKLRRTPPPRAIVVFAVISGAAPLLAAAALAAIY